MADEEKFKISEEEAQVVKAILSELQKYGKVFYHPLETPHDPFPAPLPSGSTSGLRALHRPEEPHAQPSAPLTSKSTPPSTFTFFDSLQGLEHVINKIKSDEFPPMSERGKREIRKFYYTLKKDMKTK